MRRHARKPDLEYLSFVHDLPCCVDNPASPCSGRITAHHAGERGLGQKAPDRTAIPLCLFHHQAGPHAVHRMGRHFWKFHGLDKAALIDGLQTYFELYKSGKLAIERLRRTA